MIIIAKEELGWVLVEDFKSEDYDGSEMYVHLASKNKNKVKELFDDYRRTLIEEFVENLGWFIITDSRHMFTVAREREGDGFLNNHVSIYLENTTIV